MKSVTWSLYSNPPSPIAFLAIGSTKSGVFSIKFHCKEAISLLKENENSPEWYMENAKGETNKFNEIALRQLSEYFDGTRTDFDVPLDINQVGTQFQRDIWEYITKIPYSETKTYGEIASDLNRPQAARAVGQALKSNPIPFLIPCHRVIRSDGQLGGFGGSGPDIKIKKWLLSLENTNGANFSF